MSNNKELFDFNTVSVDIKVDKNGKLYFSVDDMMSLLQFEIIDNKTKCSGRAVAKSLIDLLNYFRIWASSDGKDSQS